MNVLIEDGYISALSTEPIPARADVEIEGSGQFLIPGLWDMHVHWDDKNTRVLQAILKMHECQSEIGSRASFDEEVGRIMAEES
jgi:imidazolonepropionase-like amidohydrolase|tara:strand:- start:1210 stop:1461 length:252 start_codon:yes stop_codon:yes gene_type:complete